MCTCGQCAHITAHVWIRIFNTHMPTHHDWQMRSPCSWPHKPASSSDSLWGSWKEKERKCWRSRVSGSLSFNLFTAMTSGAPEWALRAAGWGLKAWSTEQAQSQPRRLSRLYLKLTERKNQREGEKRRKEKRLKGRKEGGRAEGSWQLGQWWLTRLACRSPWVYSPGLWGWESRKKSWALGFEDEKPESRAWKGVKHDHCSDLMSQLCFKYVNKVCFKSHVGSDLHLCGCLSFPVLPLTLPGSMLLPTFAGKGTEAWEMGAICLLAVKNSECSLVIFI